MIELTSVRLERPRLPAPLLDGADLLVGRGEVVLVTGGAGTGTSTLVDAILGEVAPASGDISVYGRDLGRLRRSSLLALRRRLGIVPQSLELLPERSALANVALPLEIDHVPRGEIAVRAALCLGRVGLAAEAERTVGTLSLAQQQRVALARALVRAPRIIIADQPTCHQDAAGAVLIADLLAAAAVEGAAVLVISRDPNLVTAAARRGWRHLALVGGSLVGECVPSAFDDTPTARAAITAAEDSLTMDISVEDAALERTDPGDAPAVVVPKVLPFPVTHRSRGVG
jgi:ABC-type ATPase involved in cell division